MTNDTKAALEKIKPLAEELSIQVDADDRFLYCDGQAIGIGCNSAYATINEFIGYAMIKMCIREQRFEMPESLGRQIKRYWLSKEQYKKLFTDTKEAEAKC